jgi:dTDP-4-dehydrorhamnose reductase
MKTLIFGQTGQLASEFKKLILEQKLNPKEVHQVGSTEADFLKPTEIVKLIKDYRPTQIINCSAYTAVDKAETEKDSALQINGFILGVIGEAAKKIDSSVVHYSTDYVFNGEKKDPYIESDMVQPINYYGYSKSVGEKNLAETCAKFLILRVSWVYGIYGTNFLKTMLRLGQERPELKIVSDQIGAPTSSRVIAETTLALLKDTEVQDKSGIYHMTPYGETSWHGFTEAILERARKNPKFKIITESIVPITSSQFPTPAKRPKYSLMSAKKLKDTFGLELPEWSESLEAVLKGL